MKNNTVISKEDVLLHRGLEAKELQRELEHLQARIEMIKLDAMEKIYREERSKDE